MISVQEIEQKAQQVRPYLSDITDQQAKAFAYQVIRLDLLKDYKTKYPEDFNDNLKDLFVSACKALDYTKPYRIAIIGNTGVGKSTFNNALVGRNLLFTRSEGKAATGTVLEIFFDNREEIAIVKYRHQAEIKILIQKVFQKLGEKNLVNFSHWQEVINASPIDAQLLTNLRNLNPNQNLSTGGKILFDQYKDSITDIVQQYLKHGNLNPESFNLNNPQDLQRLNDLTDENSLTLNQTSERRIGLIKKVTYKIKPNIKNGNLGLHFPSNVCLVDLPGLDGSLLHDLIIIEGIKDADAVIYINNPRRIDTNADIQLLSEVKQSITLNNNKDTYKGIFFVLTARDNVTKDENYDPTQLPQNMRDFLDKFLSGYTQALPNRNDEGDPYFYVSSIGAYYAQKLLRGETLKPDLQQTYEQACIGLGIKNYTDYQGVLNASRMPKLVEKLKHFVFNERIDQQINNGKFALDSIINFLTRKYQEQKKEQTLNLGNFSLEEKVIKVLEEKEKELKRIVFEFHSNQRSLLPNYGTKLAKLTPAICQDINQSLIKQMPVLWEQLVNFAMIRTAGSYESSIHAETLLSEIQIKLWHQLTSKIPLLAEQLVQEYRQSLQQQKLANKIIKGCYETVALSQLEKELNDWIEGEMQFDLAKVASRIGLVVLGGVESDFLSDSNPEQRDLFIKLIYQIPPQQKVNENQFLPLMKEIEKQYAPAIQKWFIPGLINVYRYEYTVIEDKLFEFIRKTFHDLRYQTNSLVKAKIQDEFNQNPQWKELARIEQKLALLQAIPQ